MFARNRVRIRVCQMHYGEGLTCYGYQFPDGTFRIVWSGEVFESFWKLHENRWSIPTMAGV